MAKRKTADHETTGKTKKRASKKKRTLTTAKKKPVGGAIQDSSSADSLVGPSPTFPIVGLGASAGGLEALEEFFKTMSADSGMAFVVVMHQAAKHVSLLPEILSKSTQMSVQPIQDSMTVRQNCVYIVPPGKHVDLLTGALHLSDLPEKHVAPLPIDYFFRSLSAERRERAVAIVLSGTGTDGTVGLSAIKGESGMVMVQSVDSAKFSGMPQNAIDAGLADYVLPPDAMPKPLIAYARGPFLTSPPTEQQPTRVIQHALPRILLKLRHRCGHDFSGYKSSTICRRIERRMNLHQIDNPDSYLKYLDQHEPEAETLFRELLIGVTAFFRDPWAFEALSKHVVLPLLKAKDEDAQFRVWVPGCSTGEEAYSIAILIRECMDELKIHLNIQIFATDLDDQAIEAARMGLFPSGIGADVSVQRLGQFFTKEDSSYRIRKELRDWLVFAQQNVIHDPPFTKLDLISCRNLLIYMQAELQKKLLTLFHYSLMPNSCMFLGTSETASVFDDLFESLDKKAKIFRRRESATGISHEVQFPVVGPNTDEKTKKLIGTKELTGVPVSDSITRMLAADFAPPTVVVNKLGEIVYVHGHTGRFLELAPGGPTKHIMAMAREGLELDLSSAMRTAARQDLPVVHENVPVKVDGDSMLINLTVQRITEPTSLRGMLRISFQTVVGVALPIPEVPTAQKKPINPNERPTKRERELELELQQNRQSLQHTIEQLDVSNEEMKSTNEELQSTNEELQSTNEELETSKEELQSLNEELQTVNAEFQDKIRDLSLANDDMTNLLNSTDIATIFLDNALNIKRYTEKAKRIVSLIPTDLGRSLRDLTSHLQYDDLMAAAEQVLKTLVQKQCEVQTEDGNWLLMRILPYRTSDDRIEGLVVTFVDINALRIAEEERALRESLIDAAPMLISCLDTDERYVFTNVAYEQLVGKSRAQIKGMHVREAIGEEAYQIAAPRIKAALLGDQQEFENHIPLSDGTTCHEFVQYIPRRDPGNRVTGIYVMAKELTPIRVAEACRVLIDGILEADDDPLLVLDEDLRVRLANSSFYRRFQVTPDETENELFYELGDNQWDIPALHKLLRQIIPQNSSFEAFEVIQDFPMIGRKRMHLNARSISPGLDLPCLILLSIKAVKE